MKAMNPLPLPSPSKHSLISSYNVPLPLVIRKQCEIQMKNSLSSVLILLILLPLVVVSVIVCALSSSTTSQSLSWFSLSSQWKWSGGSTSTTPVHATTTNTATNSSNSNGMISNSDLDAEEVLYNPATLNSSSPSSSSSSPPQFLTINETTTLLPFTDSSKEDSTSTKENRYSKLEKIEAGLAKARTFIREAAKIHNLTMTQDDPDYVPQGPIYRNAFAFHQSYLEMEKQFKIFVYPEGEPPIFHNGPCKSIYSTEGRFIHQMEMESHFRTNDPDKAHVFFLPFSVVMMVQYLYKPNSHEIDSIGRTVIDYVDVIARKYPYWNRSLGADHFMLSCHDWGPRTSSFVPELYKNSIRVLCNANTSEGFNPSKDASFPEIHLRTGEVTGLGGPSPSHRSILAFFAGRLHGHIRLLLLEQWKNKDQEVQVYDSLPDGVSYDEMLKKSKYCLCPSGYEVASPRVVEAIYAECVPVLISDHYVAPFSDVLNWNSFSVQIDVKDIPNIKKILMGISQSRYLKMHRRVKQVQKHFVVNGPPKRFDVFHMIIHSIWLRRLNFHIED